VPGMIDPAPESCWPGSRRACPNRRSLAPSGTSSWKKRVSFGPPAVNTRTGLTSSGRDWVGRRLFDRCAEPAFVFAHQVPDRLEEFGFGRRAGRWMLSVISGQSPLFAIFQRLSIRGPHFLEEILARPVSSPLLRFFPCATMIRDLPVAGSVYQPRSFSMASGVPDAKARSMRSAYLPL